MERKIEILLQHFESRLNAARNAALYSVRHTCSLHSSCGRIRKQHNLGTYNRFTARTATATTARRKKLSFVCHSSIPHFSMQLFCCCSQNQLAICCRKIDFSIKIQKEIGKSRCKQFNQTERIRNGMSKANRQKKPFYLNLWNAMYVCMCTLVDFKREKWQKFNYAHSTWTNRNEFVCVCMCADCGHFQRLLIFRFRNQRRKLERNMHVSLSHSSFYYKALQTPPFKLTHFALHFNHNTYDSSMDHRQFHRFMYASKVWIIRLFCAVTGIKPVGIH